MSGSLVVPRGAELCFLPLAAPSPGQNQAHGRAGSVLCPLKERMDPAACFGSLVPDASVTWPGWGSEVRQTWVCSAGSFWPNSLASPCLCFF